MQDFTSIAQSGLSVPAKLSIFFGELVTETSKGIQLKAVYYESGGANVDAFLHDYALLAEACLAVASKIDWIALVFLLSIKPRAQACVDQAIQYFADEHSIGYYFTAEGAETPVARRKEWFTTPLRRAIPLCFTRSVVSTH